jgi:4-hydroxyphenylpyruvate dioxygenase
MSEKVGEKRKMVGFDAFMMNRTNPMSDKFDIDKFHHLEFYCSDATQASRRFSWGLGLPLVAKSDISTGNSTYASYILKGNDLTFIFTAPYNNSESDRQDKEEPPHNGYSQDGAHQFVIKHGFAVKAVGIRCADANIAFRISTENGAVPVKEAYTRTDKDTGKTMTISEIKLFDDTIIRWVSGEYSGPGLPNYKNVPVLDALDYGIIRLDHCVSNVPNLFEATDYLAKVIGFHEFSEFTAEDVGTVDSGLNSMVMASNNEFVLMPVNEPTHGTKRKSQIQTYLEHNNGSGVQHLALKTDNIFYTMREMRKRTFIGGFDFMPKPSAEYYKKIPGRIGEGTLTKEQLAELEELGLLADRDDQGVLLQVFTKPLGDRPTIFIEIIQRIGCDLTPEGKPKQQAAGCGGFGKGNFSELFKSIENFEKQAGI